LEFSGVLFRSGHFSPVARRLGTRRPSEPVVAAQEIEFPLDDAEESACDVQAERPELYFTPDLLGYGWWFRKRGWLNVGFGRRDSRHLSRHVQEFCRFLVG